MKKQNKKYTFKQGLGIFKKISPYISEYKLAVSVVIFLLFTSSIVSVVLGLAFGAIIDDIPGDADTANQFFDIALIVCIGVAIFIGVVRYAQRYILEKVSALAIANIRSDIFDNIVDQELSFFDQQSSGEMQTRIISDTQVLGQFISSQIPAVFTASVQFLGGIVGTFLVNVELTIIVLIALPLIFSPFALISMFMRKVSQMLQKSMSEAGRYAGEAFRYIKIMQAYNKGQKEKVHFKMLADNIVDANMRKVRLQLVVMTTINAVAMIGAAFLLWYCAKNIHVGLMTTGEFVSFSYFVFLIITAAGRGVGILSSLNYAIGAANKIADYLAIEKCIWPSKMQPAKNNGKVEFRNVKFSYPTRPDFNVLKRVNLTIEPGTHTVIIGPSGSGKSTLLELVLRFYQPQEGQVLLDNIDVNDIDVQELRALIGFVPQKEILITGTILENISYGNPGASLDSVREAARAVNLDKFIESLPNQYNTSLGEVANRLSGGQKQRLSLARAIICKPKILLLDEANSALDMETDRHIAQYISQWAVENEVTIITVAHRLSTVEYADKVVIMEDGNVVDEGHHNALIESNAIYQSYIGPSDNDHSQDTKRLVTS